MTRRTAAVVSATALAILGSGAAGWATQGPAVCHPVEGKGSTGYGWNLISPDKASSHIDESTGTGKHTRKDGRTDSYAVNGVCPGAPTSTPTGGTPSPTTTTATPPTSATTKPGTPSAITSTTTHPSPSTTSSTPSRPATTTVSSPSATPPPTAPTSTTNTSSSPSRPTADSPPSSVPSSTGELARTGADLSDGAVLAIFGIALGLLLGWCAWILGRVRGDH